MAEIKKVFGIDLGTTYSAVATLDEVDRPMIVPNDINEPTTPSVVYFESPENVVVGVEAKNMAEIEPEKVVQFVKRFMGRKDEFAFEYNGKSYAPEEISAIILKALVEKAQQNVNEKITDVVITVPAYFDDAQRVATKNAGIMAGLNVLDIINEPIAAALAYGIQAGGKKERVMVYDLGGGTFDVSVIEVSDDGVKILVTGGRHQLGGKDWDDRLITYLDNKIEEEHGVKPLTDPHAHQELRTKAEALKKRLSAKARDPFTFSFAGFHSRIEMDREKFEEITADHLEESIKATRETLDDLETKTGSKKVDRIFLVGGSSRMPIVKTRVDQEFGIESKIHDPDECVAKGAALWAVKCKIAQLQGEGKAEVVKDQIAGARNPEIYKRLLRGKIRNVTSHTYGIKAWDRDVELVVPMLVKNTEIPKVYESSPNQFGTADDNQATIDLVLMEADGDSLDPEHCKEIGHGTVELTPGVPKGSEVKIWFNYGADGTMTLRARETSTNRECEVTITRAGVMDDAQVMEGVNRLAVINAQ